MKIISDRHGFTFIEVLVTLVILSTGIIAIFQSFLRSLDYMSHINKRLYATVKLDDRIDVIQRMLRNYNTLPVDVPEDYQEDAYQIQQKFLSQLRISAVDDYIDIFQLDLSLNWKEKEREINLSRHAYLADFGEKSN